MTICLGEYLSDFYLTHRSIKPSTAEQLAVAVTLFERWNGEPVMLGDITERLVSQWLADYADRSDRPPSPVTVANKRRAILTLWRHAWDQGLAPCPHNHRVRNVTCPAKHPVAWTIDEMGRLLHACQSMPHPLWFRAYVLCGYDTALRLGDLWQLHFDQIGAQFSIVQNKSGTPHVVYLRQATIAAIQRIREPVRKLIFGDTMTRRCFFERFQRLVKLAGVRPGSSKFIRRTSASYVERDNPGQASKHLGHSSNSPGLAEASYIDPTIAGTKRPRPPEIG